MIYYLDTSVLVSLFVEDTHTRRARKILLTRPQLLISDFGAAEFASAISGLSLMGALRDFAPVSFYHNFDGWCARTTRRIPLGSEDIRVAESWLRKLDLGIRTPDAMHLAIVQRMQAKLATFDKKMALAASKLGIAYVG